MRIELTEDEYTLISNALWEAELYWVEKIPPLGAKGLHRPDPDSDEYAVYTERQGLRKLWRNKRS